MTALALSCASITASWAQTGSDPPATDPPATDPPATDPPSTDPDPATADPATAEGSSASDAESQGKSAETDAEVSAALAEAEAIPEFDRVRTPSSPAFAILGLSPTDIQRATTPRDFALIVASALKSGSELSVPKDLAIEIAPYWFFNHKRRTYNDFMRSGVGANALRNLSISVGSSSREVPELDGMGAETGNTLTESRFAVGLRTQLYAGHTRAEICGGDVQKKTLELAKQMAGDEKLEDPALKAKELLAVAQLSRWQDVLPVMRARDAAEQRVDQAKKTLDAKDATPEAKESATEELAQSAKDLADAKKQLEQLAGEAKDLLTERQANLDATKKKLDAATDDAQKKKLERDIANYQKQLVNVRAAAAVTEQAVQLSAAKGAEKRLALEAEIEEVQAARKSTREKRIESEYDKRLGKLADICKDASAARLGWNLSVAAGLAWTFPESKFADGDLWAASGWLTLAHTWKQGVTAAAMARLSWTRVDDTERATLFDTGARVIFARSNFAFSGEAVVRTNSDARGVRAALIGEYMVSKGKWLSVSFGKDFTDDTGVFTLANLTWGVGGESAIDKSKAALSD